MRTLRFVRTRRALALSLAGRLALGGYAALTGLNAQAADINPVVASAFGNTVLSTYPDGTSQKLWFHADGTWTGLSRRGDSLAGRWRLKGDKVCLRQTRPATLPMSYCTAFPQHSEFGAQWASHDVLGRSIQLSLQKGMPEGAGGGARSAP